MEAEGPSKMTEAEFIKKWQCWIFPEYNSGIDEFVSDLSALIEQEKRKAIEQENSDTEICKKCGKQFIPHLIKPLTICDDCYDKLGK